MTEDQRKEHEAKKKQYEEAVMAVIKDRRATMEAVALTEPGKKLFRYLHDVCGFEKSDRVMKPDGSINAEAMLMNAERREVYLRIRQYLPPEVLREIELPLAPAKTEEKK